MPSFEEMLAARKNAKPKTERVEIILDTDASDTIADLEAQLEAIDSAPDQRLGAPDGAEEIRTELERVRAESAGTVVVLEFERLPGYMWTDITIRTPARLDAGVDLNYGYNLDEVVRTAAKAKRGDHSFAWRVDGDKTVALTDEQWDDLFEVMSGHEFQALRDVVFILNEFGPAQRLAEAKKGSAGTGTGSS